MITLEEAKLHLRVDHDDEDAYITGLIDASTWGAMDYLDVYEFDPMPAPVKAAILLQVGDLYESRERQGDRQLYANATYERLLNPYRLMGI